MRIETNEQAESTGRAGLTRRRIWWLRILDDVPEAILAIAVIGELLAIVGQILTRAIWGFSFLWTDEIAHLALATLTFFGGAVAYRRRHHASILAIINLFSERRRILFLAFVDWLVLVIAIVMFASSIPFLRASWSQLTPILEMPAAVIGFPLPVSMAFLALYAAERLWLDHRRGMFVIGAPFILLLALVIATQQIWQPWFSGDAAIYTSLTLFFVAIFAGLPVAFSLLFSTAIYLWISGSVPMEMLPGNMLAGTGNFVLLTLPFFILAGFIMERGGISLRLIQFVHALVGHLHGGLLQVVIVSMYLVSGLSGSKSADVVAVGSVMRNMLKRHGYSSSEAAAVLAAAATMGETVPPSIAMLVLGSITQLSMAALFIGGLIPAAVIAVCLMILVFFRSKKSGIPLSPRTQFRPLVRASIGAILPLLMPTLLMAGILAGIGTPTEISSFAVVYGLVLAVVVYREMGWRETMRVVVESAVLSGMVLFIISAAASFSFTLTIALVPQRLVLLLNAIHNDATIFMIGSIILLIVVGSILEGLPALNILVPLLFPIAAKIGINQLQYGVVLVIAMGLGTFLPPVGNGFYVCCAVAKSDLESASRAMFPYFIVLMLSLLLIAFVPWFTLVLPNYFGYSH